jgi:hypothetical protein
MFGIGVGPALIILGVLGNAVFDIPVVNLAPAIAVVMCVAAYAVSREIKTLHLGFAVVVVATVRLLVKFVSSPLEGQGRQVSDWVQTWANTLTSNGVVIAVSTIAFILALLYGRFGPLRRLPKLDDLLREREEH